MKGIQLTACLKICQPYDRIITKIIVLAFLYLIIMICPTKPMCIFQSAKAKYIYIWPMKPAAYFCIYLTLFLCWQSIISTKSKSGHTTNSGNTARLGHSSGRIGLLCLQRSRERLQLTRSQIWRDVSDRKKRIPITKRGLRSDKHLDGITQLHWITTVPLKSCPHGHWQYQPAT